MTKIQDLFDVPQIFNPDIDKYLSLPSLFSLIVIFQGCFGGLGLKQTPQIIDNLKNSGVARFLYVSAISYTASQDIEIALFTTLLFFFLMHLLRTEKEKNNVNEMNGEFF